MAAPSAVAVGRISPPQGATTPPPQAVPTAPQHHDPMALPLSEEDAVREVKQYFRQGMYEQCFEVFGKIEAQGGWRDKKRAEEGLWLRGMIDKRRDRYERAIEFFDKALDFSVALHADGQRIPSKECMELLKGRGICNLYLHKYQSAIRDFKEWLKLQVAFWPKICPTPVYYNLGLCYKYIFVFDAADTYFKLAEASAEAQADPKTRAGYLDKARSGLSVISEFQASRDEAVVMTEVEKLYSTLDGVDVSGITDNYSMVPQLLVLRTKIHFHLAAASWLFMNRQQALESFAREAFKEPGASASGRSAKGASKWFQWSTQPQDSVTNRHSTAIKEVVTAFLAKLTGASESKIRKNLTSPSNITVPSSLPTTIRGIKRQCVKFACEFAVNHMNMFVWSSVQLTPESIQLLQSVDEHPPILPFLRTQQRRKLSQREMSRDSDHGVALDDANSEAFDEESLPIVDQEVRLTDFIPRCRNTLGESPLLNDVQRCGVCKILPIRNCMQHWNLCYSTKVHGFLFSTFLGLTSNIGPNIVIVKTLSGDIFGGYSACSWYPDRNHYGNGETRVFSVKDNTVKGYSWTCLNRYFVRCSDDSLCFGGGSSHAFSVEGHDLVSGSTGYCPSFDSPPLASETAYQIQHVECWSFIADAASSAGGSFCREEVPSYMSVSNWQRP